MRRWTLQPLRHLRHLHRLRDRSHARPRRAAAVIGRFAIRYLGDALRLSSVAFDPDAGELRQLTAYFDWRRLDGVKDLKDASVRYWVNKVPPGTAVGTRLTVSRLKRDLDKAVDKSLLSSILEIVSPIATFDLGPFAKKRGKTEVISSSQTQDLVSPPADSFEEDPGFRVVFAGFPSIQQDQSDIAQSVIDNCWARLQISLSGERVKYTVKFKGDNHSHVARYRFPNNISKPCLTPTRGDSIAAVWMEALRR